MLLSSVQLCCHCLCFSARSLHHSPLHSSYRLSITMINRIQHNSPQYQIILSSIIHPDIHLPTINKEYRLVNGSDDDSPIFANISSIHRNERTSIVGSLGTYRNSTDRRDDGHRYASGRRIKFYPLPAQFDLRSLLVKRRDYAHTPGLPAFTFTPDI